MSEEPNVYYVVMCLRKFSDLAFDTTLPFPVQIASVADGEPEWLLPVFATREAAEAWGEGKFGIRAIEMALKHE